MLISLEPGVSGLGSRRRTKGHDKKEKSSEKEEEEEEEEVDRELAYFVNQLLFEILKLIGIFLSKTKSEQSACQCHIYLYQMRGQVLLGRLFEVQYRR